ncbi:MAG: hypothetical protein ACYDBQ_11770, partial [Thermoplasmatota archaeon]
KCPLFCTIPACSRLCRRRLVAPVQSPSPPPPPAAPAKSAVDGNVAKALAAIKALDGGKGARWDDVLKAMAADGVGADPAEAALGKLMDLGEAYEPTLGILKAN